MKNIVLLILKYLMAVAFIAAGINHFVQPDFYINIMPQWLPAHAFLVALSGATEIVAGVMLAIPRTSRWGAWFIIAHLVVFFAVHIDMIANAERYPDMTAAALWIRLAIQFVLIGWAWLFTRETGIARGKYEGGAIQPE